jgi:hypothetical protein
MSESRQIQAARLELKERRALVHAQRDNTGEACGLDTWQRCDAFNEAFAYRETAVHGIPTRLHVHHCDGDTVDVKARVERRDAGKTEKQQRRQHQQDHRRRDLADHKHMSSP